MKVEFQALDYTAEDRFFGSTYTFEGEEEKGWKIFRNGKLYLELGPGYKLLRTKACGVCSTDIDRRFLPFPLPQVIGHEVIAEDPSSGESYVVEINDTLLARGSSKTDAFILSGLPTHSPERMVLGIDRLPGGFGPYILAPKNSIFRYEGIPDRVAVLIEPFAASLQAVSASPPENGETVAVLGPRRLGSLLIAALNAYRNSSGKQFQITGIVRRDELLQLSLNLGADSAINLKKLMSDKEDLSSLQQKFSIVYDTTSTEEGFLTALELASKEVHLKTTNGQVMAGLNHLTELVVDELSILPFTIENLDFHWKQEERKNQNVYIAPDLQKESEVFQNIRSILLQNGILKIESSDPDEALRKLESTADASTLPRYDLAVAGSFADIETCIRPVAGREISLVRPRGAILYLPSSEGTNPLERFFQRGGNIRSSRCGDFRLAIRLLKENPQVIDALDRYMISHIFPAEKLPEAYKIAKTPEAIKVMITHKL